MHPGGEQRFVAGDAVGQRGLGGGERRARQMSGGGRRGAVGAEGSGGLGTALRALPGIGGVRRLRWLHALLLRRLWFVFVFWYHRSPPA